MKYNYKRFVEEAEREGSFLISFASPTEAYRFRKNLYAWRKRNGGPQFYTRMLSRSSGGLVLPAVQIIKVPSP